MLKFKKSTEAILCGVRGYKVVFCTLLTILYTTIISQIYYSFTCLITQVGEYELFIESIKNIILLVLFGIIIDFFSHLYITKVKVEILNNTDKYYFKHLYQTKAVNLQKTHTGVIVSLMSQIRERKSILFTGFISSFVYRMVYLIFVAFKIANSDVGLCAVFCLSILFIVVINILTVYLTNGTRREMIRSTSNKNETLMDFINGIMTVKKTQAYSFLKNFIKEKDSKIEETTLASETFRKADMCLKDILCFFTILFLIMMLYVKGTNLELLVYLGSIVGVLQNSVSQITIFVFSYFDYKSTVNEMQNIIQASDNIIKADVFKEYRLENVNFQYLDSTTNITIEEFIINKGDKIIITGESGQGKTTLLNILTGYIEPIKIEKYIDNQRTDKILDGVIVTQDVELFDLSVRDNLTLGADITDEVLLDYIHKIGLTEWYNKLERGLDSKIGEKGNKLSVGQKQRLAIIRGLLMDKEIYFFDEPTSNLDFESEMKVMALIKDVLKDKTCIIITHRMKLKELGTKFYKYEYGVLKKEYISDI